MLIPHSIPPLPNLCELLSLIWSREQGYIPVFFVAGGTGESKGPYLILHEDAQQHRRANCLSLCIPEVIRL